MRFVSRQDKNKAATHIKRHTEGTSNEISLDVLDAARDQMDGGTSKRATRGILPGVRVPLLRFFPWLANGSGIAESPAYEERPIQDTDRRPQRKSKSKSKGGRNRRNEARGDESVSASHATAKTDVSENKRKRRRGLRASSTDKKNERQKRETGSKGESRGAVRAYSPANDAAEIERRKARRRKHRNRVRVVAVAVVIVVIGVLMYAGYNWYATQQSQMNRIGALVSTLSEADKTITRVDEAMADPLSSDAESIWNEAKENLPAVRASLQQGMQDAETLSAELTSTEDKSTVDQIYLAMQMRIRMIDAAEEVLDGSNDARNALAPAQSTWQEILEADSLARDASASLTEVASVDALDEAVAQSKEKSQKAQDRLNEALTGVKNLKDVYEALDTSTVEQYCRARLQALTYAIAADDALVNRDESLAQQQNDLYASADAAAVELAYNMPDSLETLVRQTFSDQSRSAMNDFNEARTQAGTADSVIRSYLGAHGK